MSDSPHQYDLEVRIPVGLDESMWTRAAYIARAIRVQVPNTRVRLSVGYPQKAKLKFAGRRFKRKILGQELDCYYLPEDEYMPWYATNNPHMGTIMERFKAPFESERVIFLDADTFPIGNILQPFMDTPGPGLSIAGSIAHGAPFENSERTWQRLSGGFLHDRDAVARVSNYKYTGRGMLESHVPAPPYFNTGVLYASATYLKTLQPHLEEALVFLKGCLNSYFVDQVALTLAILKTHISPDILDIKWNFPNDPSFDDLYPDSLSDCRWIHFLRYNQVNRDSDFKNHDAVRNFIIRSDLKGSNEILRKAVAKTYRLINTEQDPTTDNKFSDL